MTTISGSVGRDALNKRGDVKTVQRLLNKKIILLVPLKPLVVDGRAGSATIGTIEEFQERYVLSMPRVTGRVDVGGVTILELDTAYVGESSITPVSTVSEVLASESVSVRYGPGVATRHRLLSEYSISVVKMALLKAGMDTAVVTSTIREPEKQARIMYDNAKKNLTKQFRLYGATGDQVLEVFKKNYKTKSRDQVVSLMLNKIDQLGKKGRRVSRHVVSAEQYRNLNVFDIGVNSTKAANVNNFSIPKLTSAFLELKNSGYISKFIDETSKSNTCWHLEIKPNIKSLPLISNTTETT